MPLPIDLARAFDLFPNTPHVERAVLITAGSVDALTSFRVPE
jgi:hypothetical protein